MYSVLTHICTRASKHLLRSSIHPIKSTVLRPFCCCMHADADDQNHNEATLSRLAEYILSKDVKRMVVLTGAGLSTASGIPDFRTPGCGLYDNVAQYGLPYPEAVFDLEYFYADPVPFYKLAKEIYPSCRYRPNIAHYFIRYLHEQSKLLRVYTQNIDSLERTAGVPLDKLVEAHGTLLSATCIVCRNKAPQNMVKEAIDLGVVAKCPQCQNVVKPDIVFFGENLPERFWSYKTDVAQTDLLFVMGTSLEVYPFAAVADSAGDSVPRVLFNRELVGSFRRHVRPTDFVVLGSIVESTKRLAQLLNWYDDLKDFMNKSESSLHVDGKKNGNGSKSYSVSQTNSRSLCTSSTSLNRLTCDLRSFYVSRSTGFSSKNSNPQKSFSSWTSDLSETHKFTSSDKSVVQESSKTKVGFEASQKKKNSCKTSDLIAFRQYLFPSSPTVSDTESDSSQRDFSKSI